MAADDWKKAGGHQSRADHGHGQDVEDRERRHREQRYARVSKQSGAIHGPVPALGGLVGEIAPQARQHLPQDHRLSRLVGHVAIVRRARGSAKPPRCTQHRRICRIRARVGVLLQVLARDFNHTDESDAQLAPPGQVDTDHGVGGLASP